LRKESALAVAEAIRLTDEPTKFPMARSIPCSRWDRDERAYYLEEPTPRAAAVALRLFPSLGHTHPQLAEIRDLLRQDVRPFDNAAAFAGTTHAPTVMHTLAREGKSLYEFQDLDIAYVEAVLRQHGGAYIGWERGLGKTLATCCLIDSLEAQRTLVVAPNTAKDSVWRDELEHWFPDFDIEVLPNEKRKRERLLEDLRTTGSERPLVLVVHYEALHIIAGKNGRGWDKYGEWDLMVLDEAHRIANPKTKMARAAKKVPARARVALSGSIIQNHAEELFSVLQWLHPDRYKSKWRDWNDRFLDYVDGGYGRVCVGVKPERLDEMRTELGVFMVYRRKEDELDLPSKTEQTLLVDLSAQQRRVYEELRDSYLSRLDDGAVVKASDGLVLLTRLRQVATGLDLLAEDVADSSKLDLALELIEDNQDEQFVVVSWYKAAAYALTERLEARNIPTFVVTGDTAQSERADCFSAFTSGDARVLVGTLSTMGESVNLQTASNAVFLDRSWNPATNAQAADRIYRIGQTKPVTITHIVARDTVDELNVLPALQNKDALRRIILGG
jgi:SNF2 family DNA or RNA helicase